MQEVTKIISTSNKRGRKMVQAIVNGQTRHLRVVREVGNPVTRTIFTDAEGREYFNAGGIRW